MVEMVSGPLVTSMLATGNIRNYQIVVGGIQCLNVPIAWMLLHYGAIPEIVVFSLVHAKKHDTSKSKGFS